MCSAYFLCQVPELPTAPLHPGRGRETLLTGHASSQKAKTGGERESGDGEAMKVTETA